MNSSPKGQCYKTAIDTAYALIDCCRSHSGCIKPVAVVHGSVHDRSGRRVDHAWVEIGDDEVVDKASSLQCEITKDGYIRLTQAIEEARYTTEEALENCIKHGHWGPWHTNTAEAEQASGDE